MSDLSPDLIREFVLASHFNLEKVQTLLAEHPELLNAAHQWGENDFEDGLGAAAHVGNRPIAELLISKGAPVNICVAAMLGNFAAVKGFVDSSALQANARGAHGISVMFHAALSGETSIAQLLKERGSVEGYSHALFGAIMKKHAGMVEWLLNNGASPTEAKDYEGKTALQRAIASDQTTIADLLRQHGATE
jgi:ankyrin repeat protein